MIAITGIRAMTALVVKIHDIGLRLHKNADGETGFEVLAGGGLGRTLFIAKTTGFTRARPRYPELCRGDPSRVYNQYGRDNIHKARIKILRTSSASRSSPARWRRSGSRCATAR